MRIKYPVITLKTLNIRQFNGSIKELIAPYINMLVVPVLNKYRKTKGLKKLTYHMVYGFIEYDPTPWLQGACRNYVAAHWISDLPGYFSPLGDNKWIEGRVARREHLARNNCRELDTSEWKPSYKNPHFTKKHGLKLTEE